MSRTRLFTGWFSRQDQLTRHTNKMVTSLNRHAAGSHVERTIPQVSDMFGFLADDEDLTTENIL